MPAKATESVLTEDQKSTLIPHINAFRKGDRTVRAQIVRKLANPMSTIDDPPLVQSKYYKVIVFRFHGAYVLMNMLGGQKLVFQPWPEARKARAVSS